MSRMPAFVVISHDRGCDGKFSWASILQPICSIPLVRMPQLFRISSDLNPRLACELTDLGVLLSWSEQRLFVSSLLFLRLPVERRLHVLDRVFTYCPLHLVPINPILIA